jgi:hypothetical protein
LHPDRAKAAPILNWRFTSRRVAKSAPDEPPRDQFFSGPRHDKDGLTAVSTFAHSYLRHFLLISFFE